MKIKNYLLATVLVGLSSPTSAADLAARPYTKAPVLEAAYDWTGFYAGINAGVGSGRNRIQHDWAGLGLGTIYSFYTSPQGGFAGGQAGYNWQTGSVLGPIVFGIEADIQGSGLSDDRTNFQTVFNTSYSQKLDWFGTVRGRVGISDGPVLSYVTAGYAFASVKTDVVQTLGAVRSAFSTDRMQDGWVVGSGIEAALGGNWTGKIEYLYLNLGNKTDVTTPIVATPLNSEIRQNVFRAGLNYRFGGKTYASAVPANWAGFYLGGNFGAGTGRDRASINVPGAPVIFETFNLAPDGINGGVQAGYNWQAANWVFGFEADIQGSTQQDNKTCVVLCIPTGRVAYDATLPWFGTVRGRLGYSVGPTLFYATGGLAYGSIKTKLDIVSGAGPDTRSYEDTNAGWTVGAGIETPFKLLGLFGPNWTTKAEYLYVDLGSTSGNFMLGAVPSTATRSVTEHIFRTGINYHINAPVVAKY